MLCAVRSNTALFKDKKEACRTMYIHDLQALTVLACRVTGTVDVFIGLVIGDVFAVSISNTGASGAAAKQSNWLPQISAEVET